TVAGPRVPTGEDGTEPGLTDVSSVREVQRAEPPIRYARGRPGASQQQSGVPIASNRVRSFSESHHLQLDHGRPWETLPQGSHQAQALFREHALHAPQAIFPHVPQKRLPALLMLPESRLLS